MLSIDHTKTQMNVESKIIDDAIKSNINQQKKNKKSSRKISKKSSSSQCYDNNRFINFIMNYTQRFGALRG